MEYFSLTTPQQNIWNLQKYYEDTAISNICGAIFFQSDRNIEVLKKAINQVIQRQMGMRLRFVIMDGEVKQYVKEYSYIDIPVHNFEDNTEFEKYALKCAVKPIGLIECEMFRLEIVLVGEKIGIFAILSHLISDAWTFNLLAKEIDETYFVLIDGKEPDADVCDYINYVKAENEYFESMRFEKDSVFWQKQYDIKPENSSIKNYATQVKDIKAKRFVKELSSGLSKKIQDYCQEKGVTPAVFFETALYSYLFRINSDNNTITLGIPVLNRVKAYEKETAGMFISTIPLTVKIEEEYSIRQLAERITKAHFLSFRHQRYPYSMILNEIRDKHAFEGNLYDVMFSFQNAHNETDSITKWFSNGYSEVPFILHVDNRDNCDIYRLTVDYQMQVFPEEEEVNDIILRIEHILEQMIANDSVLLKDVSIMSEEEKQRVLFTFNDTAVEYPRDKCVHELFMEQAKKTPNTVALIFEGKEFTYREVDEMSNVLAHFLREKGVQRGDIVPIIAKRSWHIIVAMLGILKAGAAYMPVAPDYPKDRIQFIIKEAGSKVGCIYGYAEKLEDIECFALDKLKLDNTETDKKMPVRSINEVNDLCYVIFTSGSTGVPKGVMIKHSNVINYVHNNKYNVCNSVIQDGYQKIISVTNIVFDIFVTESILPLLNGKTIFFTNDDEVFRQNAVNRMITENKIEVLQTTPTKIKGYLLEHTQKEYLSALKVIILGGEALTIGLFEELRRQTNAKNFNIYGPAETTVWSSNAKIDDSDITIGRPIANTQIYILDKNQNLVPIGVAGELCIAGEGIGLGYLNRPDLTEERFVPNPFATEENGHGKIMYHTGDLAAWREDGEIEYLGRMDTQVKIRGLRIELGEIESVMAEFPGISMCAVTDKKDEEGRQYLVGYYTTESDTKEVQNIMSAIHVEERELRKYLSSKLPKYMIPNYFMHLNQIPMTPSGKTDRKNLPIPLKTESIVTEYVEPVTELEKKLCQVIEHILGYSPIGVDQDFFSYGGDSLKAIELVIKLEELGFKVKLQDIFEYPIVADLAKRLKGTEKAEIDIECLAERFYKYESLLKRNRKKDIYEITETPIKTVFISGITGFLGAHIANELLQDKECIIYCLVRNSESGNMRDRLAQILEFYFGNKYKNAIDTRIFPIEGDITDKKFMEKLPIQVDIVIHAAATVKHYGSYDFFYKINTLGTQNMVNYAQRMGAKFIHISTISVSGNSLADNFNTELALEERLFDEACLYQNQSLKNVYVRSKFEAECVVLDAMLQGLQANIVRVGNLTNRSKDYVFQPNYKENAFLSRIKAALDLGSIPEYMMSLYSEFSPVDETANAIVRIARHFNMDYVIFHVYSNQNLYFNRLVQILKDLSIGMEVVEEKQFIKRLKETVSNNKSYIYEAFINDMDENGKLIYETNIHIQNDFTISYLKQLGFEWSKIDYEYVKGYIQYFNELGWLEVEKYED